MTTSKFYEDVRPITDFQGRAAERSLFMDAVREGAVAAIFGDLHSDEEAGEILASFGK